jgi:hypothetical protein
MAGDVVAGDVVAGARALWQVLHDSVDFFGKSGTPPPADADLPAALQAGALLLPQAYQDAYIRPVTGALPHLLALRDAQRIRASSVAIVTGGVTQHAARAALAAELQRFVAVISDLYRSFLDSARRRAAGMPAMLETLPPLAAFQYDGADGPITIAADLINQATGGTVGVVALPATFADHPVLWTALAHETGGHDVTHADPGLLAQLQAGLPDVLAPYVAASGLAAEQLRLLWAHWMDEAAADIYAVMNAGPAFVENAAVVLMAMNGTPALRMASQADAAGLLDPHPADVLRLHLGIGAIGTLGGFAGREAAAARIAALAAAFGSGTRIGLSGTVTDGQTRATLATDCDRAGLAAAAEAVGRYIATAPLTALGGQSIQAIETWDDADQAVVEAIRAALAAGQPIAGLGDDAQVLAAASAAVMDDATAYQAVTAALNAALDHSFQTDPVWQLEEPDRMYLRSGPAT